MARVSGPEVKAILADMRSATNEIGGSIKGQCRTFIQELGEKWQSPDAALFLNATQDSFNGTFNSIIGVLNTNGRAIASNGVAAISADGGDASGINWLDISQSNISESGSIHNGIGGDASDVLYDPAVVREIPGKVQAIYNCINEQLGIISGSASSHPMAFEGTGQSELIASLRKLQSSVSSNLDEILSQLNSTAEGKASMLQESISTVKTNLTGN